MKKTADLPVMTLVTKIMADTVRSRTAVRMGEVTSMAMNTTTSVATEEIHWGIDWEII